MEQRVNNLAERLAALEVQNRLQEEQAKERAKTQQEMAETLHDIKSKIDKWEGKFGAVIFVVGCLWAFATTYGEKLLDLLRR